MTPEWMDDAACRNLPHTLWLSSNDDGVMDRSVARHGALVCFGRCLVRADCLANSMVSANGGIEPQGIWGGLSYPQRVRYRAADSDDERTAVLDDARRLAGMTVRKR